MDYFSQPLASGSGDAIEPSTPLAVPGDNTAAATPRSGPRTPAGTTPAGNTRYTRPPAPPNAPSVRLRRLPSTPVLPRPRDNQNGNGDQQQSRRRRSNSEPQRAAAQQALAAVAAAGAERRGSMGAGDLLAAPPMSPVEEEAEATGDRLAPPPRTGTAMGRRARAISDASARAGRSFLRPGGRRASEARPSSRGQEYEQALVDLFDVMDPEVSTLTTLNNVQNSLFIPYLGSYLNRTSTYDLGRVPSNFDPRVPGSFPAEKTSTVARPSPAVHVNRRERAAGEGGDSESTEHQLQRSVTLTSVLSTTSEGEGHNYAVLPHGVRLEGWTEEEKDELNDYVRHLMHSRREGFKRTMHGFKKYVHTPLGAFVTVYSFLLTFWGAAWVLFLIGWISVGGRKDYFVNIADSILVALFNLVGIGLAPFRAVDTYHMAYIAYYHRLTLRLRRERALPKLQDHNDLPETARSIDTSNIDLEAGPPVLPDVPTIVTPQQQHPGAWPSEKIDENENDRVDAEYAIVLTPQQQVILKHHQDKFSKSHTFYKPHETTTHHAFSFKLLITAVTLLDCHSLCQFALAGVTWGMNYKIRPIAVTTAILCCSITCNISAGVVISLGDHRTRKKQVIEQMFRQDLTRQAIEEIERKGRKSMNVDREQEGAGMDVDAEQEGEQEGADVEQESIGGERQSMNTDRI